MSPDRLLKVEGAGNDFLLGVGRWAERLESDPELGRRLCDRRRGLGADGVLALLVRATGPEVEIRYRNADGSPALFCANATRCAARVAVELLGLPPRLQLVTAWASITAEVAGSSVTLELPAPQRVREKLELELDGVLWSGAFAELGIPHLVIPVRGLDSFDLATVAPGLRHHPHFGPEGSNVSFTERRGDGGLAIRSFERGVEGETLCCGSAVAAAGLLELAESGKDSVELVPRSGATLQVAALGRPPECGCRLTGPANIVAEVVPAPGWLEGR